MKFAALAFFVFSGASAARLAVAGFHFASDSTESVERAAAEVESSDYALRLAELDPDRAGRVLKLAIRWNPRSSPAWIALGLAKERAGEFDGAARDLLQAAEIDRQYLPAWTLANFYFRGADRELFAKWARRSAALIPGDLEPLLVLCDRMEPGNALDVLPREKRWRRAYLDFLIRENRLDEAERVARGLADDPEDLRRLAGLTTRLIDAGKDAAAIGLWRGPVNADLRAAPSGEGFDWRMPTVEGVAVEWKPGRLTFRLSGRQPDACVLLEQGMPVESGRYRLGFEYATDLAGLRWALDSSESAELAARSGAQVAAERSFRAARSGLAWLRLIYRRDPGVRKAEGEIEIRSIQWAAN